MRISFFSEAYGPLPLSNGNGTPLAAMSACLYSQAILSYHIGRFCGASGAASSRGGLWRGGLMSRGECFKALA